MMKIIGIDYDGTIVALVDDDERHLEGMEVPDLRRILLKSGCQEAIAVPDGVELARSWQDVLRIVTDELFTH